MKRIFKLFILFLFFLASPLSLMAQGVRVHVIKQGETLASISKKYNVSFSELLSINPNINKTPWKVGNKIFVPEEKINTIKIENTGINTDVNMGLKKIPTQIYVPTNVKKQVVFPEKQQANKTIVVKPLPTKIVVTKPINNKQVTKQISRPQENSSKTRSKLTVTLGDTTQKFKGRLPFPLKQEAKMSSNFGSRWSSYHEGIDIPAKKNAPIYACHDGVVVYSSNWMRGYGNMVVIETDGIITVYAHNNANIVKRGAKVSKGDRIGYVGSTGHSTGNHLHFETRIKANNKWYAVNPKFFLFGEK